MAALRDAGWRLLISPTGAHRSEGFQFCMDNGAWTAHAKGGAWREDLFMKLLDSHGHAADFVVAPDVVGGGKLSLARSLAWLPHLLTRTRMVLLPVQDGMEASDVGRVLSDRVGVFVGGTDDFKFPSLPVWAALCRDRGAWLHVGRVNTKRAIRQCAANGADSFDGSGVSRFEKHLQKVEKYKSDIARSPEFDFIGNGG